MTTTPILNGQILGQAEHAARAVLDQLLTKTGVDYRQWVVLNQTAISGNSIAREALVARVTDGLKISEADVLETIATLAEETLVEDGETVVLTDKGAALQQQIRAAIGDVTARLYRDMSQEDLAIAAKVLITFTAHANAELATV